MMMLLIGEFRTFFLNLCVLCDLGADGRIRSPEVFRGFNHLHFGSRFENYVTLPIIPPKEN